MSNTARSTPVDIRPSGIMSSTAVRPERTLTIPSRDRSRPRPLALDITSPVNQRGHFEFDRVVKSGSVLKRTRKTKSWRAVSIVLRPGTLSIYRNADETKLRHKISLSEVTAVARQKDPKGRAKHVFGIFSPSRNFHLAAKDDKEAQEWVEVIRQEARMDHEEADMNLVSPGGHTDSEYTGFGRADWQRRRSETTGVSSSDAEAFPPSPIRSRAPTTSQSNARRPSTILDYSGPENASQSDLSDAAGPAGRTVLLGAPRISGLEAGVIEETPSALEAENSGQPQSFSQADHHAQQEEMQARASVAAMQEAARIVCEGWILLLKSHSGVKQWKKTWMVLRTGSLAMYKNEKEYTALRIISLDSIVDVVEIDPISSSKRCCLQVITEDKGYRLCAPDEDALAKWLGAFKSLLVRRREANAAQQSSQGP